MANEFVIKNGYFSQGNSNVTGSLQVTGSVGVTGSVAITQDVTASKALFSSSNNNQLTVIGSGSTIAQIYGSQGNLLTVNDTFSGSIFTVTDISGYPILDITSDYYTSVIQMIGTASLTGSLSITENLEVKQNITASKALISSSGNNQLIVMGSGSSSWITGIYGSQGNLLTVTDTFSGSLFTISDISGYPILDVISNTSIGDSVQIIGTSSLTGSLFVNQNGNTPFVIDNNLINFYVTESKYWEVGDKATSNRLFRMRYQTTPIEGVLVQIGGISSTDTVLTVDQTSQTITLDAPTASILQLIDTPQTNIVTIDTTTGQLFYTASSAIGGGGGGTPGGSNKQIQFNANGAFSGSSNFIFDSASNAMILTGSIDFGDKSQIQSISASSGDGGGYATLTLKPDANLTSDQYIVLDPTTPNHIHIRAGGLIDSSSAYLYLGGEKANIVVRNLNDSFNDKYWVQINSQTGSTQSTWVFDDNGVLNAPGRINAPSFSGSSFTGSLLGTASFATTASYVLNASSTFNSTSSFIGNGALTTWNVNHGFNTLNLHITVYSASGTYETVYPDIRRVNANTASIVFANPPSTDQYIVYISQ